MKRIITRFGWIDFIPVVLWDEIKECYMLKRINYWYSFSGQLLAIRATKEEIEP